MKVFVVFGTRPEAIKMCPLIIQLKKEKNIQCVVCLTGQHREMLEQVMTAFQIKEDYNLNIMRSKQTLTTITVDVIERLAPILDLEKPDLVLVHGDTTTSYAAALASFYQKIPVGHVESGLRTGDIYSPFPEEMNRLLTDRISTYFFAPTQTNAKNLEREGINKNVFITGNTVIDSFQYTVKENYIFHEDLLNELDFSKKIILVTAHRRENLGEPLEQICQAVLELANQFLDCEFVYPMHKNPGVRMTVEAILNDISNVHLIEPIDVLDMHNLMARCYMVLTDSGGIQEEAPHFGKPVLVLRTETERPEAVDAGTVKVVGVYKYNIVREATALITDSEKYNRMAKAANPYGDGKASKYIVNHILSIE